MINVRTYCIFNIWQQIIDELHLHFLVLYPKAETNDVEALLEVAALCYINLSIVLDALGELVGAPQRI